MFVVVIKDGVKIKGEVIQELGSRRIDASVWEISFFGVKINANDINDPLKFAPLNKYLVKEYKRKKNNKKINK